jgi:hypothetical protein
LLPISGVAMVGKNMDSELGSTMLSEEGEKRLNCSGFGSILCQFRLQEIVEQFVTP